MELDVKRASWSILLLRVLTTFGYQVISICFCEHVTPTIVAPTGFEPVASVCTSSGQLFREKSRVIGEHTLLSPCV